MKRSKRVRHRRAYSHDLSEDYLRQSLKATPRQKLEWLEEAFELACRLSPALRAKKEMQRKKAA